METGGRSRRERRTRRRREYDYVSFPEEILVEILKRLPIKSLLRFISVCKSWYSLITSPNFIYMHSKQIASTRNSNLVLVRDCHPKRPNKELYSVHLDDETFEKCSSLDFPVKSLMNGGFFRVVGCVNGVLCLSDDIGTYTDVMVLWNPSIKKFVHLPLPLFRYCTHGGFVHCVGFGFDDSIEEFKVVRVVYLEEGWGRRTVPPRVEIYEPRVGSWREVDTNGFRHIIDERSPQVFLHGNVHWVSGCKLEYIELPNTKNLIVSFDLRSETFGTMKVPDSLNQHEFRQDFCVSALGESLSLIHDTSTDHGNTCCVWVMKQYGITDSWTKLLNIDVTGSSWRVFGFRRSGEALVKARRLLFSLEPKSRNARLLTEFENWKALYVDDFVESLALLGAKVDPIWNNTLADTEPPEEDSSELEDDIWCQEAANPSMYVFRQPVEALVSWFG